MGKNLPPHYGSGNPSQRRLINPLNELPDRLPELPEDKFFITFCFNGARAILAYAFLRTRGFDEVKALEGRVQDLAHAMSSGTAEPIILTGRKEMGGPEFPQMM